MTADTRRIETKPRSIWSKDDPDHSTFVAGVVLAMLLPILALIPVIVLLGRSRGGPAGALVLIAVLSGVVATVGLAALGS